MTFRLLLAAALASTLSFVGCTHSSAASAATPASGQAAMTAAGGHDENEEGEEEHPVPPGAKFVKNGEAKVGDATHCPVSGEAFVVQASSPHVEYQGKTYYFCCPHCPASFTQDPQKYLSKLEP